MKILVYGPQASGKTTEITRYLNAKDWKEVEPKHVLTSYEHKILLLDNINLVQLPRNLPDKIGDYKQPLIIAVSNQFPAYQWSGWNLIHWDIGKDIVFTLIDKAFSL